MTEREPQHEESREIDKQIIINQLTTELEKMKVVYPSLEVSEAKALKFVLEAYKVQKEASFDQIFPRLCGPYQHAVLSHLRNGLDPDDKQTRDFLDKYSKIAYGTVKNPDGTETIDEKQKEQWDEYLKVMNDIGGKAIEMTNWALDNGRSEYYDKIIAICEPFKHPPLTIDYLLYSAISGATPPKRIRKLDIDDPNLSIKNKINALYQEFLAEKKKST